MEAVEDFVKVGKALADPTRVRILSCLAVRELCVCELVHLMDLGQPAVQVAPATHRSEWQEGFAKRAADQGKILETF